MTETIAAPRTAPTASPLQSGRFLPGLVILFIGSGCAALIYEIVWLQLLQLTIGASAISLGVLLATFMGGMCIGSLLFPRVVSRKLHPLQVYALLELAIGLIGILEIYAMPLVTQLYVHMASGPTSVFVRALFAGVCLLPPTILMGATLPAIARWVETTPRGVSWMGFFYGGNIVGAVIGCLAAGFYLLPNYDMKTATFCAAAVNFTVATLGLLLSVTTQHNTSEDKSGVAPAAAPGAAAVYIVIALSGFTGLGAEVVWTRALSLMLGATVYTFSNILAVFLLGLGIGSSVGAFLARSVNSPRAALGWCQFLLAAAIAWTAYAVSYSLPLWPINPQLSVAPSFTFQIDLARCCWAVLPGAVLWGASFPLALAAVAARGQDPGRLVGGIYAANTVGAIAGALLFSMVVVPLAGTQGAQQALIGICAVSALLAFGSLLAEPRPQDGSLARSAAPVAVGMAAAVIIPFGLALTVAPPNWGAVAFGRYSATWAPELYPGVLDQEQIRLLQQVNQLGITLSLENGQLKTDYAGSAPAQVIRWVDDNKEQLIAALRKGGQARSPFVGEKATSKGFGSIRSPDRYCAYVGEGMNVTVAVTYDGNYRYFHGAGKVQASSDPADMRLQRTLGHITALMRRGEKDMNVLVVACGAGVTAGSFVPYDNVGKITICDIEPMVPHSVAQRFFGEENHHVIDDPRTNIVIDDGRHFVETTREKFDVITSDPIDPWVKGCAALNTIEYYQMCKAHLKPGGVMALWIPLYESNEDTSKSVIATFFQVFKNGILWSNDEHGRGYDAVLFGRADDEPTQINLDDMQTWIDSHPKVKDSLQKVGFGAGGGPGEAVELTATFAADAPHLTEWMKGTENLINYDRNLRLQYVAGRWINETKAEEIFSHILQHYRFPEEIFGKSSQTRLDELKKLLNETGRVEH